MSIKGLTDQHNAKSETDARGRPVRLGYLQKGVREGFGNKIKLHDLTHFIFKAANQDKKAAEEMETIFKEVYGATPRAVNDVRIPVGLAGNFDIEKMAWMTANKNTEKGSIFLAQSDGETITKARDESGKVRFGLELSHEDYTQLDDKGKPCFVYRKKLYPWSTSMAIDLILPELNQALFERRISGLGVVTLLTHSHNDIPTLIGEYHQILDEIVGLFADPRDPQSMDRVRRHAPLRDIPLRLYRSEDKITSPAYGQGADPADRIKSTRWLLHWQINPDFALAMHKSRTQRTALLLQAVGNAVPLLAAPTYTAEDANQDLLGLPSGKPTNGNGTNGNGHASNGGPKWEDAPQEQAVEAHFEELDETDDLDAPEVEVVEDSAPWDQPEKKEEPEPEDTVDWKQAALEAKTRDGFCMAVYELHRKTGVFETAILVNKAFGYMFGAFKEANNEIVLGAFSLYINGILDGAKKEDAIKAAKNFFVEQTTPKPAKQAAMPLQGEVVADKTYQEA